MKLFKKFIKNSSVLSFFLKPMYLFLLELIWFLRSKVLSFPISFDAQFKLYPNSHISKLLYLNEFEVDERKFLKTLINSDSNVVNIGANVGLYTVLCGILANRGSVYSFEPDKENFLKLEKNVFLNNLNNINLYNWALGSDNKKMFLYRDSLNPDLDSHYSLINRNTNSKNIIGEIECFTMDSIFKSWKKNIDILIMDVEGFESEVLLGAREFLKNNSNCIFMIEVTNNHQFIFDFMKEFNFFPYILQNNELFPIDIYHGNVFFKKV
jgi:FkbM family methyltransferase